MLYINQEIYSKIELFDVCLAGYEYLAVPFQIEISNFPFPPRDSFPTKTKFTLHRNNIKEC